MVLCPGAACIDPVIVGLGVATTNDVRIGDIAFDATGDPLVCYTDGRDLWLKRCLNDDCTTVIDQPLDTTGPSNRDNGFGCDIALSLNRPLISYIDRRNGLVKAVHCDTVSCTSGNVKSVLGSAAPVLGGAAGGHTAVAIADDGLPLVLATDAGNVLRLYERGRPDCSPP